MSTRRVRAGAGQPLVTLDEPALEQPTSISRSRRAAALLLLFASVSLAARLPFLRSSFLNVDEAAHLVGSRELLLGGALYRDFTDNKPPLVYLFYAAAQLLFGPTLLAVRLFAALVWLPLVALAASAFFGHGRRGAAAGVVFLVASTAMLPSDAHVVHCEHVALLPLVLAMVVLRLPASLSNVYSMFSAGALIGLATLAKQPAVLCVIVPAAAAARAALRRRRARSAPVMGGSGASWTPAFAPGAPRARECLSPILASFLGLVAPLAVAAAWFSSRGTLHDAVFWIWRYNLGHIDNPMPLGDRLARIASMGALAAPSILALVAATLWARREARQRRRSAVDSFGAPGHRGVLPLLLAAATLPPAFLGLRLFGHYFLPAILALSLSAAPFFGARGQVRRRGPLALFGLFAVTAFALAGRVVHDPRLGIADVSRPEYERVAEVLRGAGACPGPLFVWGYAPLLYAYASQRPASRFVVPVDTLTGYLAGNDASAEGRVDTRRRIVAAHWDQLLSDLQRSRPAHVVDTGPSDLNRWGRFGLSRFPRLDALVRREYHVLSVVEGAVVYERNDCSGARR